MIRRIISLFCPLLAAVLGLVVLNAGRLVADDNIWTGATSSNWSTVVGQNNWSVAPFYWGNGFVDSAIFNGAAPAPITVTTPITLHGINFLAGSYTINGSAANPLTLVAGGGGALQTGEIRVTSPASPTINAVIGGSVGLKKTGNGALLLRGANTYTGGTTVSSGALQFGQGGTVVPLPAGNVSISPGAAMAVFLDTTSDLNLSNDFSNTGLLQFLGTNVSSHSSYSLSGNNSGSSGALWVGSTGGMNAARLVASAGNQLGTGDVTVYSGSGIYLPGGTYTNNFSINGNGWSEASGQLGALRLENGATIAGAVVLQSNARVANFFTGNGIIHGTISGPISGPFNLEKTGAYELVLTGNNTYGSTTISEGTLQIGNGGTTGVLPGNTTNNRFLTFSRSDTYTYGGVISGTGSVSQIGSGTMILTGANTYTGTTVINPGGTLQIGNGGTTGILPGDAYVYNTGSLVFNRSDPVTYAGVIGGQGEVIQGGAGTLTLSAANTYEGGTTIRSGAITAGVPNALLSNTALTIGQPDTATNGRFNTGGLAQTISGLTIYARGGLGTNNAIDVGTGTLTLNGDINLLDTTTGAGNQFGSTIAATAGGTLNLGGAARNITVAGQNVSDELTINAIVTNGAIIFTGNPSTFNGDSADLTLNASVPNTYAGGTRVNAGTLNVAATTTLGTGGLNLTTSGAVPSTVRFNSPQTITRLVTSSLGAGAATVSLNGALTINQAVDTTFAGIISGNGPLVKRGAGALTLTGANTYTGGTTVNNNGFLLIGNGGDTGILPSGNVSIADFDSTVIFDRDTTSDLALSHNFSGPGVLQFLGVGVPDHSSYQLTGNNSGFTGAVVVGGTADNLPARLVVNSAGQLGNGETVVFGGSSLYLNGGTYTNSFKIKGDGWAETSGAKGALRLNNASVGEIFFNVHQIALDGNSSIYTDSGVSTIWAPINGPFALEKTGPGTLFLKVDNSYTGGTVVSDGTLQLGEYADQLPANSNVTVGSGATFDVGFPLGESNSSKPLDTITLNSGTLRIRGNSFGDSLYFANNLMMTGGTLDFSQHGAGFIGLGLGGDVTINASSTTAVWNGGATGNAASIAAIGTPAGPQTITVGAGATPSGIDLDSSISLFSTLGSSWVKAGLGVMRLTNVETDLDLVVAEGKLRVDDVNLLNRLTQGMGNSMTVNGGTLQYGGPTATSNAHALPLGSNHGFIEVMSDATTLTLTNVLSGPGILVKDGPGTLILTGTSNTYSGGTLVRSGQLLVNNISGSGAGAGNVQVDSGGTLGGAGSISGLVTVNSGGHLAPGDSIESLDVGSLVLRTGSILDFELGAPGSPGITSDLINVTASGGLTFSGGSVALTNAGGLAAGTYTLIDYAGALDGIVASLSTPTGPAGFSYALFNNAANTSIDLTVSAAGLLGDYDGDNDVDGADFLKWQRGESPNNGSAAELADWRAHYGEVGSTATSATVPEPATLVLLIFAAAGISLRHRKRG